MRAAGDGKYWDRAWSLVDGCTPVSPACDHCWLRDMDRRFHPENLKGVTPRYDRLEVPLKVKKPTVWAVWSDLFHESIPRDFQEKAFCVMGDCPQHTFLVLTKRPEIMEPFVKWFNGIYPHEPPNIWLGVTAEDQEQADKRIPILLQIPAVHWWVSLEPMLGEIDIIRWLPDHTARAMGAAIGVDVACPTIDCVVLGGETGPGARPMHPDWVRSVRDQCAAAGVPFFFKSWGEWANPLQVPVSDVTGNKIERGVFCHDFPDKTVVARFGTKINGRLLDGREHNDLPWRKAC